MRPPRGAPPPSADALEGGGSADGLAPPAPPGRLSPGADVGEKRGRCGLAGSRQKTTKQRFESLEATVVGGQGSTTCPRQIPCPAPARLVRGTEEAGAVRSLTRGTGISDPVFSSSPSRPSLPSPASPRGACRMQPPPPSGLAPQPSPAAAASLAPQTLIRSLTSRRESNRMGSKPIETLTRCSRRTTPPAIAPRPPDAHAGVRPGSTRAGVPAAAPQGTRARGGPRRSATRTASGSRSARPTSAPSVWDFAADCSLRLERAASGARSSRVHDELPFRIRALHPRHFLGWRLLIATCLGAQRTRSDAGLRRRATLAGRDFVQPCKSRRNFPTGGNLAAGVRARGGAGPRRAEVEDGIEAPVKGVGEKGRGEGHRMARWKMRDAGEADKSRSVGGSVDEEALELRDETETDARSRWSLNRARGTRWRRGARGTRSRMRKRCARPHMVVHLVPARGHALIDVPRLDTATLASPRSRSRLPRPLLFPAPSRRPPPAPTASVQISARVS